MQYGSRMLDCDTYIITVQRNSFKRPLYCTRLFFLICLLNENLLCLLFDVCNSRTSHLFHSSCWEFRCSCDLMQHSLNLSHRDVSVMSNCWLSGSRWSLLQRLPRPPGPVRVIFFKGDASRRPSAMLTERLSGMFTPQELLASQSCHRHLCLFHRMLPLSDFLMMQHKKKQTNKHAKADRKTKPSQRRAVTLCLLHIPRADPSHCAVTVICLHVESNKTVWKTAKWV